MCRIPSVAIKLSPSVALVLATYVSLPKVLVACRRVRLRELSLGSQQYGTGIGYEFRRQETMGNQGPKGKSALNLAANLW